MTNSIQQSEKNSLTGRLKELLTDISLFIDKASEDQKQKFLSILYIVNKTECLINSRYHSFLEFCLWAQSCLLLCCFFVIAREVRPKQSPLNKWITSSFIPHSSQ